MCSRNVRGGHGRSHTENYNQLSGDAICHTTGWTGACFDSDGMCVIQQACLCVYHVPLFAIISKYFTVSFYKNTKVNNLWVYIISAVIL